MAEDNYLKTELYANLRKDDVLFDFLQESSLDGLWYWDLDQPENEWMSESFWRLFGVDPATRAHFASEWQDIIHPDDLQTALENFQKHLADPTHPYDQVVRYTHADGSTVTVRCRGVAIRDADGTPRRMLGAHSDMTELAETRKQLAEANARLAEELSTSKKHLAVKSSFLSMMSHEIRTPLNAIMGLLELIEATATEEKQARRAGKALGAAQQLFATLSMILEAARLEVGVIQVRPVRIETKSILVRMEEVFEGISQRYGYDQDLRLSLDATAPEFVSLDPGILFQVLTNLLDNAVKYSNGSAVSLAIAGGETHSEGRFSITVEDQGIGIPPELHGQVFEPFRQAESGLKRSKGGTGLGLSIVKQLVSDMAGVVILDSARGVGTRVTIELPTDFEPAKEKP
ncbi:MAG: PAS domain-containing sensor histidine kinase [Pseudomonadota bacterium]